MKKLIIKQLQPAINSNDIINFENTFEFSLPENYKEFLLKSNGGLVKTNDSEVNLFLSLRYGQRIEDEIDIHQLKEENIPKGYLPIALDWSDNPITLNLNEGEGFGQIVIFELDFEGERFLIANSLEELLGVNNIDEL